jgi:tRNA (guanine-N7-)-methyltransferase
MKPAPEVSSNELRRNAHAEVIADRRADLSREIQAILENTSSLTCEIGSGHGHFLTAFAARVPDQMCVGVDLVDDRVARANRKRDRAALTNLHFFHADARLFLETLPARTTLHTVFVLFPDPWPKKRHHKNRTIQPEFLNLLGSKTLAGARLYFRTDHAPYFEFARATVDRHTDWRLVDVEWPFEHVTVFQARAPHYFSFCAERRP